MLRARFAAMLVAAGLAFVSGCMSTWCNHPLLNRLKGTPEGAVSVEGPLGSEGPILGESGPFPNGPINPSGPPPAFPQNTVPPLAPAPRLIPQPDPKPLQSNPMPFTP
ncbi:MAG TPA: hypothetical protein VGY77_01040 [Gemmataceae bacterium]|jgi:hypothetical protein|nr:hypothetical protein [Gemmataceae bacterium]